ncbi:MAG: PP2C family protein-serine/threonine phosphatase [Acidobacteriota bacterium]
MHPILGNGGRLLIYLGAWTPISLMLAAALAGGDVDATTALAVAVPIGFFYGFVCLAAWFPARVSPLRRAYLWQSTFNHLLAAVLSTALLQLAGSGWAMVLERSGHFPGAVAAFDGRTLIFVALGILLYLLSAAGSYVYLAALETLEAERSALDAEQERQLAEQEMALARSLQRRLLPPPRYDGDGVVLAARNLAAQGVAGDFYDYFTLPDGDLRLAVADVAGKGMAASLIMATVKAILPLISADRSLRESFHELNRHLEGSLRKREFVALAVAHFEPSTGRVELMNAGLPDPFLLRADGAIETVEVPQPRLPLGLRSSLDYQSVEVQLAPGDRLLLFTDGLPEAPVAAEEPFGYDRLEALLDAPPSTPHAWLDGVLDRLRDATLDDQDDDWTALLFERPLPDVGEP